MPGVYISYPFCSQKCSFCNFASGLGSQEAISRYNQRLLDEVRSHDWQWSPETLYFGGGTPSLMEAGILADLFAALPKERLGEITLECAPGTITEQKLRLWSGLRINRVSLGVQSFIREELRQTGRRHTAENVQHEVGALRASGITNINLDLIAGLPGQTHDSWSESLDWIERLESPHVSIYIFEIDEDSRLGREALLGGIRYGASLLPNDDLTAELYEYAVSRLGTMGIHRYEISNFARAGMESRHNLKYWLLEPYVGFGVDAHSFNGRFRWSNPDTLDAYCAPVQPPQQRIEADRDEEQFFVGLRLSRGIEPTVSQWAKWGGPIEKWRAAGMLEREGGRLRLSDRGVLVSNEILQEFLNA